MAPASSDVTRFLRAAGSGDAQAWESLLSLIYNELRSIAGRQMRKERAGHTFQRTALVNEAYIRLLGDSGAAWENRAHFFAAAAEAMRRVLVDHARQHNALKRGGGAERVSLGETQGARGRGQEGHRLDAATAGDEKLRIDVEALHAALSKLEADERHRDKCAIIKLHCFVGLTLEETAQALDKSLATVKRDWTFARAWLYREMTKDGG